MEQEKVKQETPTLVESDSQAADIGAEERKLREFERITGQKFTNNINVLVRVKVNYWIFRSN